MSDKQKIYDYQGFYAAMEFAESHGFECLEDFEQGLAEMHDVEKYEDVPEHYQCGFIDDLENDALEFIRSKGFTILEEGDVLE
tara:strand:+ start:150 stop:398 length:249 start_codon:yes stop_codon:yes gene_type:complete